MHQNMPTQKPIWNTICISTQIQIMLAHLIPICPKLKLISQKLKKEKKKGYFLNLRERERERGAHQCCFRFRQHRYDFVTCGKEAASCNSLYSLHKYHNAEEGSEIGILSISLKIGECAFDG